MLTAAIVSSNTVSSAQLFAALQQSGIVKSVIEWTISTTKSPDVGEGIPDIVLLDLERETDAFFAFGAQVRRMRPSVKLVAVSSTLPPTQQFLLGAMRCGVQDFLPKPI